MHLCASNLVTVGVWDDVRAELAGLRARSPNPLEMYPNLDDDVERFPPFRIRLYAWAVDAARELKEKFGDRVELSVGFMSYPGAQVQEGILEESIPDQVDPSLTVTLDEPCEVVSGHDRNTTVEIHNRREEPVTLITSGLLVPYIVDPSSGRVVGGFAGIVTLQRVLFDVAPGESRSSRALVGTASVLPELGYSVPPGQWAMTVVLTLEGREEVRTPELPLTITRE
jgi:hypothetical protein